MSLASDAPPARTGFRFERWAPLILLVGAFVIYVIVAVATDQTQYLSFGQPVFGAFAEIEVHMAQRGIQLEASPWSYKGFCFETVDIRRPDIARDRARARQGRREVRALQQV